MSDKLNSSILDGLSTRPLSDFNKLNPNDFKETKIVNDPSDKNDIKIAPLASPEIKVIKSKEYDESVDELVKRVVVRAKVEAGRSKNEVNIAKYDSIVNKAVNIDKIITLDELDRRVEETKQKDEVKENNIEAELILKEAEKAIAEAEAALKNIESLDLTVSSKVLEVEMKLAQLLELKLDDSTLSKISEAINRISEIKLEMSKLIVVQTKNIASNFLEWLYVS